MKQHVLQPISWHKTEHGLKRSIVAMFLCLFKPEKKSFAGSSTIAAQFLLS